MSFDQVDKSTARITAMGGKGLWKASNFFRMDRGRSAEETLAEGAANTLFTEEGELQSQSCSKKHAVSWANYKCAKTSMPSAFWGGRQIGLLPTSASAISHNAPRSFPMWKDWTQWAETSRLKRNPNRQCLQPYWGKDWVYPQSWTLPQSNPVWFLQ